MSSDGAAREAAGCDCAVCVCDEAEAGSRALTTGTAEGTARDAISEATDPIESGTSRNTTQNECAYVVPSPSSLSPTQPFAPQTIAGVRRDCGKTRKHANEAMNQEIDKINRS